MPRDIEQNFRRALPDVDFCSLRFVDERNEILQVRQDVLQPVQTSADAGLMITVMDQGGLGYAATSDLSESGIRAAIGEARSWAKKTAGKGVTDFSQVKMPAPEGRYATPVQIPWESLSLGDKIALLKEESARLKIDDRIVDWDASIWYTETESLYLTSDGGRVEQQLKHVVPSLSATANQGAETQTRSLGGRGYCRQGGLEVLEGGLSRPLPGPAVVRCRSLSRRRGRWRAGPRRSRRCRPAGSSAPPRAARWLAARGSPPSPATASPRGRRRS